MFLNIQISKIETSLYFIKQAKNLIGILLFYYSLREYESIILTNLFKIFPCLKFSESCF